MIKLLCTKDKEPTGFLIQDVTDWEAMYNVNIILKQIEETASFYLFKHNSLVASADAQELCSEEENEGEEEIADWYLMHEDHLHKVLWDEAQLNGIFDIRGGTYEITSLQDHCYGKFSDNAYYINPNSNYIH